MGIVYVVEGKALSSKSLLYIAAKSRTIVDDVERAEHTHQMSRIMPISCSSARTLVQNILPPGQVQVRLGKSPPIPRFRKKIFHVTWESSGVADRP